MTRNERMLGYAYALTFKSEHRIPVAAVLGKGSSVIKQSTNLIKTHPLQENQYLTKQYSQSHANSTHAEVIILGNLKYSKKHSLYICRRKKDGTLGLSKPCVVCLEVIKKTNIRKITYTISGTIEVPHYGVMTL